MLTLRREQIEILDAHMMRKYEDRVIARIARTFPKRHQADGEDQIRLLVQAGIRKAGQHGINENDDVERFILLLVRHGLEFETKPEMSESHNILEDKDLPPDAKVSLLARELAAVASDADRN